MRVCGEVERVGPLSRGEFEERFAHPERPAIIAGAIEHWPARRRWSPELLGRRLGSARVRCKISQRQVHPDFDAADPGETFATRELSFAEFLQSLAGPGGASWFMTGEEDPLLRIRPGQPRRVSSVLGTLLDDVAPPALFDPERLYTVWSWFSAAGLRSWLHYDNNGCHNLNAQVRGSKRFWLFPPHELDCFYPFELEGEPPAHNCSRVDVECPDPERFPRFAQARCLEGELREGELLFLPAFWFHTFLHTGSFNANVNFWWRPESLRLNPVSQRWAWLRALGAALGEPSPDCAGPARADLDKLSPESRALLRRIDAGLLAARE
jgi:hypothetical protein